MEVLQPSWRGRSLNTRKDSSGRKYMAMNGGKALLYIPVDVLPDATYRITLELHRESGNGVAYCNIFGNRNFDFPHARIICEGNSWNTYDIDINTRDFPRTLPLVFRIWRSPDGTGTLLVRRIKVELLKHKENKQGSPVLVASTTGPSSKVTRLNQSPPPPPPRPPRPQPNNKKTSRVQKVSIATPKPKLLPIVSGIDGIKVSVVISIYNRRDFFQRTLITYVKQTLLKKEFELVIIDDGSSEDILGLCKEYALKYGLQFQYILIDKSKGAIAPKGFTPALSNNIGFKEARGSVIVITGPESLQGSRNLEFSWNGANKGYCVYGNIFRSSHQFVDELKKQNWSNMNFDDMAKLPGAKTDASVLKGWWWYYVAVRKEHLLAINGVNERFMEGMTGEDDDFALRMSYSGVPLLRNNEIIGIHQDHSREDKKDVHAFRFNKKVWMQLREFSARLLKEWTTHMDPVTNRNIDWGSVKAIIKKEVF